MAVGVREGGEEHLVPRQGVGRGGNDRRPQFQFELEAGEGGAGFGRVVRAWEKFLVPNADGVGPHRTGAAGLFVGGGRRGWGSAGLPAGGS